MPSKNDVRIQTYVDPAFYQLIESYAEHHQISVSKALAELAKQGLSGFSASNSVQPLPNNSFELGNSNQNIDSFPLDYVSKAEFESFKFLMYKLIGNLELSLTGERALIESAKIQAQGMYDMAREIASKAALKAEK